MFVDMFCSYNNSLCLFLVLVPVPNVENTPSILEVDFFHLLVGVFFFCVCFFVVVFLTGPYI